MTDAPWHWVKEEGSRKKMECDFHGSQHANYGLHLEADEASVLIRDKDLLQERSLLNVNMVCFKFTGSRKAFFI